VFNHFTGVVIRETADTDQRYPNRISVGLIFWNSDNLRSIKKPFPAGNGLTFSKSGGRLCMVAVVSLRWYYPGQVQRVLSQAQTATPATQFFSSLKLWNMYVSVK
jgi:hypothetical protein